MKKPYTIISVLLCVTMLLSMFCVVPISANTISKTVTDKALSIDLNAISIVKTDIKASAVFNTDGYGSLQSYSYSSMPPVMKSALIDRNGSYLFPYKETHHLYRVSDNIVSLTSEPYVNYSLFSDNGLIPDPIGFYTMDGHPILTKEVWGASPHQDGYAFVTEYDGSKTGVKCYLIDKTGNIVLNLDGGFTKFAGKEGGVDAIVFNTLSEATWFSEGLLPCWSYASQSDFGEGNIQSIYYMDINGNTVLSLDPAQYSKFWSFSDGLAGVKSSETGQIGYINKTGELVIPCIYYDYSPFIDGLAPVSKDGYFGYINHQNETVIPFEYDAAFGAENGLATVGKDGKFGLVDYNNNIIVPLEYDDISTYENGVAYAIKDGIVYIITGYAKDKPGDADGDGQITLMDVTEVQHYLSNMTTQVNEQMLMSADVDKNGLLEIIDATYIQRYVAKMEIPYEIG